MAESVCTFLSVVLNYVIANKEKSFRDHITCLTMKPGHKWRTIARARTHTLLFPIRGPMIVHLNFTPGSLICTIVASLSQLIIQLYAKSLEFQLI